MAETESCDRRVEFRVGKNGKREKVILEKSAAEGLPPGWIKEVRITKKRRRLRRDPFYTDPKSGFVFRSLRDALRYVKTGDIGRDALKPKENDHDEEDSKDGKNNSLAGSVEQNLAETETNRKRMEQESKSGETGKDEKINIYVRNSKRKGLAPSAQNSDKSMMCTKPSISSLRVSEGAEKTEDGKDCEESKYISSTGVIANPDKKPFERQVTSSQAQTKKSIDCKLKRKTELNNNLSRRASKRIAGIEFEPTAELKTRTCARPKTAVELSNESVTTKCEKTSSKLNPAMDSSVKTDMPSGSSRTCQRAVERPEEAVARKFEGQSPEPNSAIGCRKKKEIPFGPTSILRSIAEPCEVVARKSEAPSSPKPNFAFDVCRKIEMSSVLTCTCHSAVKPCNGVAARECKGLTSPKPKAALGSYKKALLPSVSTITRPTAVTQTDEAVNRKSEGPSPILNTFLYNHRTRMPLRSNKSEQLLADLAAPVSDGHTGTIEETRNKGDKNQEQHVCASVVAGPIVRGANLPKSDDIKVNDSISGSTPLEMPLADIWKDPCIAFAIKTLTGESLDPPNITEVAAELKKDQMGTTQQPDLPENSDKINEKPGSSLELLNTDLWKDPCIEFAIKTLTGTIPLGFELDTQAQSSSQ